ncbi:hypothetical protein Tsubulata_007938 [Turnera subulata]|uniref:Protein CHUP1, chloroplastic n=1 Tax=Turnera subulata TaxID=218843 RepID=A0A9Q0G2P3_9ROSI|nr:hypothetical protein Tsubulata_007938 [Turnera subulata]
MAKSIRSKREKRLRAIRRDMVEPFYDKKDAAKLAALEAALSAPKPPVKPSPFASSSAMDATATTISASASQSDIARKIILLSNLVSTNEGEEEEEEEEVKLINSIFNRAVSPPSLEDEDLLPEFEDLLSGEIEYPLPGQNYNKAEKDKIYEAEMANNGTELERLRNLVKELEDREVKLEGELLELRGRSCKKRLRRELLMANNGTELERLRNLVKELEDREVKLEGELLEYYGLKEQESDITELQRQLKIKTVETDMLNITINSLQTERKKLQEEIAQGASARRELEVARNKIRELQRQIQLEANQTKGQLLLLKQQVSGLLAKEQETIRKDVELEKKLKAVRELEVEVVELKRKNRELQHEKRDLSFKLDTAESKVREEVNSLRHANEDLQKQVEGLQMNRLTVDFNPAIGSTPTNACLRYELRNKETPSGKVSAHDLNKSLSPRSQERAKQLISLSKRPNLLQKLKKWGRSKDDSSTLSSSARSFSGSPSRASMSTRPRGPLESLMLKNAGDTIAITSFGTMEQDPDNVASSFQLMSKSVEGVLDEKYPAYRDRHKLALEREKKIKEKAEQARAVRAKGVRPVNLPSKLAQIKEKPLPSGDSNDQSNDGKAADAQTISKIKPEHIEKRPPRVPRPPPKASGGAPVGVSTNPSGGIPPPPSGGPPPPPPPPGEGLPPPPLPPGSLPRGAGSWDKVHRALELVEFYQSLMKREAKKDTSSLISTTSNVSDARSNMIGEIENQSTFLLAVKADVETQGDFVQSLATEVRAASLASIDDLVDERAVLKHFDWPESKADALREATFEYQDLMKLVKQVSTFSDDPNLPCEAALKKMYKMLEK